MTPADAAKALDLPDHATPEQIEARFLELRGKIEERIAKAPTPGLKDKYRESINDLTQAFEVLTIAADSSALPVLKKQSAKGEAPSAEGPATSPRGSDSGLRSQVSGLPAARRKSGGKEFLIVAVIAVVVLGAGGWWVLKTKAENEEKARIAADEKLSAEAKAAADKTAAEKKSADGKRLAEEARLAGAASEKAEKERVERLGLQMRTRLAELAIVLDSVFRAETAAERELADFKAEERVLAREAKGAATPDLRAAQALAQAHERYQGWLRDHLAAHPARTTRARLDELAAAKAWDDVAAGIDAYATGIKELQSAIAEKRLDLLTLTGALTLRADPAEVDYTLRDTYGRTRTGRTPAELTDVPLGGATVAFSRPGWPAQERKVTVTRDTTATATADLVGGALELKSEPFAVEFTLSGQGRSEQGQTPAKFAELPVGDYSITYRRKGWSDQSSGVNVTRAGVAQSGAKFTPPGTLKVTSQPEGAEVWLDGQVAGATPLNLFDLPPGPVRVELKRADYRPVELSGAIVSGKELALSATLRSATLTKEEAFDKLSREGNGTWVHHGQNGLGGGATFYLRFVAGSKTLSHQMTGFGGSTRNLTMVDYDAENKIVLVMFGGLDALNGKIGIRIDGDTMLWGKNNLSNPMVFRRQ